MFAYRLALTLGLAVMFVLIGPGTIRPVLIATDADILGEITLPVAVLADCKPLAEGTYLLRRAEALLAGEDEERGSYWVEFVRDDIVRGRELAAVVTPEQAQRLNRGIARPAANEARVDVIRANAFVRIWINRGRVDYLLNLPLAPTTR